MTLNNCIRLLRSRDIPFLLFTYSDQKRSAIEVASVLNVDPFLVHKTIVITRITRKEPILAVVPGPFEVDLKKVAVVSGEKKVFLPTERETESLTGLKAGGISPIVLYNQGYQVILDELSKSQPDLIVSGGRRGLSIKLSVEDFIKLTSATIASII